jgi:hypothetical protein
MGISHLVFSLKDENEGLMVDVDNCQIFEIGIGRWATGSPTIGFNASISGLTFSQFNVIVNKLSEIRDKYMIRKVFEITVEHENMSHDDMINNVRESFARADYQVEDLVIENETKTSLHGFLPLSAKDFGGMEYSLRRERPYIFYGCGNIKVSVHGEDDS